VCEVTQAPEADQVTAIIRGHDVLLCSSFLKVNSALLEAAGPDLRAVVTISAGYNHVDTEELSRRGILLANTQGALEDSVAEIGVSLILDCLRGVRIEADKVRRGQWVRTENLFSGLGESLVGKNVGFLGLGRIGLAIAKRLKPFGIGKVYYTNRTNNKEAEREVGGERLELLSLAAESDIVVVTASLSESTRHIVDKEFLARMKSSSFLVNVARGGLVDQEALLASLQSGGLRGAGLDVSDPEPLPADHPLVQCEAVTLLPHMGSATRQARHTMAQLGADNVLAFCQGKELPTRVKI